MMIICFCRSALSRMCAHCEDLKHQPDIKYFMLRATYRTSEINSFFTYTLCDWNELLPNFISHHCVVLHLIWVSLSFWFFAQHSLISSSSKEHLLSSLQLSEAQALLPWHNSYGLSWTWLASSTLTLYIHLPRKDNVCPTKLIFRIDFHLPPLEHSPVYVL